MHLMKPELRKFNRKVSCLRKCTIECFHSATKAFQSFYLHSCENGGSCVDDQFSYHCNCTDGYRGRYCEGRYDGLHQSFTTISQTKSYLFVCDLAYKFC